MSHGLAVVWKVPNKAVSQSDSESFHAGEEMTSRLQIHSAPLFPSKLSEVA